MPGGLPLIKSKAFIQKKLGDRASDYRQYYYFDKLNLELPRSFLKILPHFFYRERRDSGGRLSKLLRRTVLGHALLLPRRSQLDLVLPVPLRAAAVGSRALRHVRVWLGLHRRKFASFALGAPVKPFLQQLSCLPPQSQSILPASYRVLVGAKSPVAEFYPTHFAIDMNNKKNPWEGVNLIPFIDIDRLTDAMDALHVDAGLSPEEQKRNAFQGPQLFQYAAKASGSYSFPFKSAVFRGIAQVHCAVRTTAIGSPSDKQENVLRLRPLEDTSVLDLTTYRTQERGVGILCAGRDSRQSTVVVKIPARLQDQQINTETLTQLVKNCKNRVVCYPLWRKHYALIEGIYVSNYYVSLKQENTSFIVPLYPNKIEKIKGMMQRVVKEALQGRLSVLGLGGVDLETVNVLLELHPIIGVKRDRLTGELHYRFASQNQLFPLQLVKPVSVITSPVFNFPDKVSIWQRIAVGRPIVFLGIGNLSKHTVQGAVGKIEAIEDGTVVVKLSSFPPSAYRFFDLSTVQKTTWCSIQGVAEILKIPRGAAEKLVSSYMLTRGSDHFNIGLKWIRQQLVNPSFLLLSPLNRSVRAVSGLAGAVLDELSRAALRLAARDESERAGLLRRLLEARSFLLFTSHRQAPRAQIAVPSRVRSNSRHGRQQQREGALRLASGALRFPPRHARRRAGFDALPEPMRDERRGQHPRAVGNRRRGAAAHQGDPDSLSADAAGVLGAGFGDGFADGDQKSGAGDRRSAGGGGRKHRAVRNVCCRGGRASGDA